MNPGIIKKSEKKQRNTLTQYTIYGSKLYFSTSLNHSSYFSGIQGLYAIHTTVLSNTDAFYVVVVDMCPLLLLHWRSTAT